MFRIIKALAASLVMVLTVGAGAGEAPTASPAQVSPDYIIGPGDTIRVDVWQKPDLSMPSIPVLPDGKFSTPLVRDIVAVGKTSTALASEIETKLAEYLKNPQVTVTVMHAASVFSQVKVIGEGVKQPQAVAHREGMTVLDAILVAGGLADFAAPNRAKLLRNEGGKQTEVRIRLGRLLNDGDMSQNHLLRPGDVLLVPASRF
jgi:polysaccharide export outer membrane protein